LNPITKACDMPKLKPEQVKIRVSGQTIGQSSGNWEDFAGSIDTLRCDSGGFQAPALVSIREHLHQLEKRADKRNLRIEICIESEYFTISDADEAIKYLRGELAARASDPIQTTSSHL
jgi:hypothetical protein